MSNDKIPLGQRRLARFLCEDVGRGSGCPHHERMAAEMYTLVVQAQAEERQANAVASLESIATRVEAMRAAGVV